MTDLFAGFTSSFADKALASQAYPLTFHFEPKDKEFEAIETEQDVLVTNPEAEVEADPDFRGPWGSTDDGEALLDVTIEGFLVALAVANSDQKSRLEEAERELIELFANPIGNETIDLAEGNDKRIMDLTAEDLETLSNAGDEKSILGLGKLWRKIKNAIKKVAKAFVKNFKKFLAKYFRFTIEWAELRVEKKPSAVVKNPLEIRGLDLHARARIEACIKIGKWRCAHITSPWVHFTVGSVLLTLEAKNPLVLATARVKDFDFVISISLFGFKFPITIGLTGIVNKQLAKRPPEVLLDTSKLSYELPMLKTKFVASGLAFSSGNSYLEADVEGRFVPV